MTVYYAGLHLTTLYENNTIEKFTRVPFEDVTDIYIDWNYMLLWRYTELWVTGAIGRLDSRPDMNILKEPTELKIPDCHSGR